jgi:hypothetical protein
MLKQSSSITDDWACTQVPYDTFTLALYGTQLAYIDKVAIVPKNETCAAKFNSALDPLHSGPVSVTPLDRAASAYLAKFDWGPYGCVYRNSRKPLPDENCLQGGKYRLCYLPVSTAVAKDSNMTVYVEQAMISIPTPYFTADMLYEVFTPFTIVVQVVDTKGRPCCEGVKVTLTLTKNRAAYGSYLYNSAGSNALSTQTLLSGPNGLTTFAGFTIRNTAGVDFLLTVTTQDDSVNIPGDVGSRASYFQVRPSRLKIDTTFDAEYFVGIGGATTLPATITVRAEDKYGNLLVGLTQRDGLHCMALVQSGGNGTNSREQTDLGYIEAKGGGNGPSFQGGIALVTGKTIRNQAGRYVTRT